MCVGRAIWHGPMEKTPLWLCRSFRDERSDRPQRTAAKNLLSLRMSLTRIGQEPEAQAVAGYDHQGQEEKTDSSIITHELLLIENTQYS